MAMTNWLQTPPMFFLNGLLLSITPVFSEKISQLLQSFCSLSFTVRLLLTFNVIFFSFKSEFTVCSVYYDVNPQWSQPAHFPQVLESQIFGWSKRRPSSSLVRSCCCLINANVQQTWWMEGERERRCSCVSSACCCSPVERPFQQTCCPGSLPSKPGRSHPRGFWVFLSGRWRPAPAEKTASVEDGKKKDSPTVPDRLNWTPRQTCEGGFFLSFLSLSIDSKGCGVGC